jgi:hypothetical protein
MFDVPHPKPDADAVFQALQEFRDEPPPSDPTSAGCIVAMIALIVLVFMPVAVQFSPLSGGWLGVIGLALGGVVIVGSLVGIFGGGSVRGGRAEDVEEAVHSLVNGLPHAASDLLTRAAVRLLDQSMTSAGPATVATFDRAEVATQLGDALPFVMAVERILLERDAVHPCFTLREQDSE